ncbi:MAG: 3-methyl-2-oxobutanoate hydroxymethyltransferase [Mycobacteriales bacterium]
MPVPPTTTLSSCARAATAAETRYRISTPIAPARGARVIALDAGAAAVVGRLAGQPWANARFLGCTGDADRLVLTGLGGEPASLAEQLQDADVVVLVATDDTGAACASALGRACRERGIMTAGLVLVSGSGAQHAVAALRPHARVLLPTADETDVLELLTALRA